MTTTIDQPISTAVPAVEPTGDEGQFFNDAPALVCTVGFDGRFQRMNRTGCRLLGHPEESLLGQPFASFFHPDDIEALRAGLSESSAGDGRDSHSFLARFQCSDGAYKWLLWQSTTDVERRCFHALAVDISTLKQEEIDARRTRDECRDAKRVFDVFVRSASVGVCCLDADCNISLWSPGAEKILGYAAEDILGRRLPIAGASERQLFETCAKGAFAGQSTSRLETRARSRTSTLVDLALSIAPLFGAGGAVDGALMAISDITDRRRTERWLYLEQSVAKILCDSRSGDEAIPGILAAIGTQLGWERGDFWRADSESKVLSRTVSWHVSSADPQALDSTSRAAREASAAEMAGQVQKGGKPRRFAGIAPGAQFDCRDLARRGAMDDAFGFPVFEGPDIAGVVLFFASDIEEPEESFSAFITSLAAQLGQFLVRCHMQDALAAAEENLLQAKKMDTMGRLVGGVVHDFNNLLTIILGYGELLLEQVGDDESTSGPLEEVIDAGKRAASLTRQLLAFCRKEVSDPVVLDLNARISDLEKMLRRLIGENVELKTTLSSDPVLITADPVHIEQVVMNLAVNARDAMPSGGQLRIETNVIELDASQSKKFPGVLPGRYVVLTVGDTGSGMDEPTRKRIFEPFFTTKPAGKGTGMGLATVSEIVRQYGGQMDVESQPNAGTKFSILLPAAKGSLASWQVDSTPAAIPRGDETILIVEDDARMRRVMNLILRARGYTVLEAGDAREAIKLCENRADKIDLVISDVVLPDVSGPELVRQLATVKPGIKVLYVSGYGDTEIRRPGMVGPEAAFLQKPFTTNDLASKVREVCTA